MIGWHKKFNWTAEQYFTDEKVIQLCKAIERNNVPLMEKLIKAGANVNAVGRDGMTPLLWAFPDDKIERFECLLKHGADAGVPFRSAFNTRGAIVVGSTVSHLAAASEFENHFLSIMKFGGNPNLTYMSTSGIIYQVDLIYSVLSGNFRSRKERCKAIIDAGVSKEILEVAVVNAVIRYDFDVALQLLEAGADYREGYIRRFSDTKYKPHTSFISLVADLELGTLKGPPPTMRTEYLELVAWLELHGENFKVVQRQLPKPIDHSKAEAKQRRLKEQRDKMEKELAPAKKQWERDREKWK